MNLFDLTGKNAMIVGGAGGLGKLVVTKAKGIPNLCGTFRGSPAGTASRAVPTQ